MESFLFVFKVTLERVVLLNEGTMLLGVPLSARVQFLDLAPLEAVQAVHQEQAGTADGPGGGARRHSVTFDGFPERHTPLFYSDSTSMIRSLQRQPLVVTLYQQHPAAPLPVVVGTARASVSEQFCDLLARATKCAARHPLAAVVRGEYPVYDVDEVQVGTVSLTARLVCFDGEALEQMRVDRASRAESTAASVSSRRASGPCTDDRLVSTTTNVCSKCMLPKRPPSTGGHLHPRQPSQATILEETNDVLNKDQRHRSQCEKSAQPAPALAAGLARAPTPWPPSVAAAAAAKPNQTSAPPARTSMPGQSSSPPPRPQPRLSEDLSELGVYGRQPSRITTAPPLSGDQGLGTACPVRARSSAWDCAEDASGDTRDAGGAAEKSAELSTFAAAAASPIPGPAPAPGPSQPAFPADATLPPRGSSTALAALAGPGASRALPEALAPCVAIPSPFSGATPRGSVPSAEAARSSLGAKAADTLRRAPALEAGAGVGGPQRLSGQDATRGAKAASSTAEGSSGTRATGPGGGRGGGAVSSNGSTPPARGKTTSIAPERTPAGATAPRVTGNEAVASVRSTPATRVTGRAASPTPEPTQAAASAAAGVATRVTGGEASEAVTSTNLNGRHVFTWEAMTHHSGAGAARRGGAAQPTLAPNMLDAASRGGRTADSDWRTIEKERITSHFLKIRGGLARASDFAWEMDLDTPLAKYGHKDCVKPPRPVPGNQGWLWNTASNNYQPRRGWYPGAIPRGLGLGLRTTRSE